LSAQAHVNDHRMHAVFTGDAGVPITLLEHYVLEGEVVVANTPPVNVQQTLQNLKHAPCCPADLGLGAVASL
jgi:hypothetical protein